MTEVQTIEHKSVKNMQFKALDDVGSFEGVAAEIGVEDLGGDIIEPGAFDKTLSERPTVKILNQHDTREVIGEGTVKIRGKRAILTGQLDMDDPVAVKVYNKLKKGLITGLSIGFEAIKVTWEESKDGFIRHINELKLWEVSIVTFPMQSGAQITALKRHAATDMSIDDLLSVAQHERKNGQTLSDITRARLNDTVKDLQALLADEVSTSGDAMEAASSDGAANNVSEPIDTHSEVITIPKW